MVPVTSTFVDTAQSGQAGMNTASATQSARTNGRPMSNPGAHGQADGNGLLKGKTGLIFGVANGFSIAWSVAPLSQPRVNFATPAKT